jgi:3-dehydroquinate dehydratase-2
VIKILVVHGPNLNLLGRRELGIYPAQTLAEIDQNLTHVGVELGLQLDSFQSNHEGELIDRIQESEHVDGFVVNPGGLGHTSVSLRDGLLAVGRPFVEVHCSNVAAREEFRRVSLLSDVAMGVVQGFGAASYELGLRGLVAALRAGSNGK